MPHINEKVSNYDKVMIYVQAAKKSVEGLFEVPFLNVKSCQFLSENMLI